jgi:tRNA(fMet)-specific endonuclease VapC
MPGLLIDTNHLGAAIRRVSPLRERLHQSYRQGVKIGTCIPVLCELEAGIQQTSDPEAYHHTLDWVLKEVRIWPIDRPLAQLFGQLHVLLQQRGRQLSHVDLALATMAWHMKLTILTTDRDFEALPEIRTENWLS